MSKVTEIRYLSYLNAAEFIFEYKDIICSYFIKIQNLNLTHV